MTYQRNGRFPAWLRQAGPGAVCTLLLLGLLASPALAQGHRLQGTVRSASDNAPLPGANIVEVGTTNGTATDLQGRFTLTVSGPNAQVAVSSVGFVTQTITLSGEEVLTVVLQEDVEMLNEVVVTALGVQRAERALGYSVGKVSGEDLAEVRDNNLAAALAGKVAGMVVTKPASGPAGSSRVVIRGVSSLEGGNQPLYIVDGIPIDNSNLGSAGMWGGVDRGDGLTSISPDDIESVSVLKGAAAAALYGSRAEHGAILINTKSGAGLVGTGIGVEYNSNLTFEDALVDFADYQTEYGQGNRGAAPRSQSEAIDFGTSSWGARLNPNLNVVQFDGVERPYALVDDKLDRFYRGGLNATNSIALTGGFQQTTFRFSVSNLTSEGIVPNSGMDRTSFMLRGNSRIGRLTADVKASYSREDVKNRTMLSDSPGNPNYTIALLPTNVDPKSMAPGHVPGNELEELRIGSNTFVTNPYWAANNFSADDERDRIIGSASLQYAFNDWLTLTGRAGQDWYTSRTSQLTPYGTAYNAGGGLSENEFRVQERNLDVLLRARRDLTPTLGLDVFVGGNRMYRQFERLELSGSGFNIPGLVTISNLASRSSGYWFNEKAINSVYGSAELSFRNYLFVTATGRNDWSSTLPADNNSYFYPSVSASFVFTDAFRMPSVIDFGKLRASWATVGSDTDPYRLALTYGLLNFTHRNPHTNTDTPLGVIGQDAIPKFDLEPSKNVGAEVGLDLRVLGNRLGIDFTLYQETTQNEIVQSSIPVSAGFTSQVLNVAEMRNRGVELLLSTRPFDTGDFSWDLDFNFAKNNNEILGLAPGITSLNVGEESRTQNARITAEVGEAYGTIRGYAYARDPQGNIVLQDGLPVRGPFKVLGNGQPDWTGGLINTFRYKRLSLRSLIHINWGGQLYSATNALAYSSGLHKNTLAGRAECEAAGYGANDERGCWVPQGVVVTSGTVSYDANGNITQDTRQFAPNTTPTFPQTYYGRVGGQIAEEFIYDASFIKLREVELTYRLPERWLGRTPIRMATVSLVGRNLLLLYSKVPNVDPESNYNNTDAQGLELAGVPHTRSIGFNVNLKL